MAECNALIGAEGLLKLPNHTYIRLRELAGRIRALFPGDLSAVRLLDIGGGAGYLACFLPEVQYVLAEPAVNGISALDLPFDRKSFDCVVACHVLEHIEDGAKNAFLDNLCDLARSNVILQNPFLMGDPYLDQLAADDLELGWEIIGAPWVKEHIDSGTPLPGVDPGICQNSSLSPGHCGKRVPYIYCPVCLYGALCCNCEQI